MKRYDVIVLGGGIIGCATAEELARRGAAVCLIEREAIGDEASKVAAGILSAQMDIDEPSPFLDLCQESHRLYPGWVRRIERSARMSVGYHVDGILYVAYTQGAIRQKTTQARWQQRRGLRVERWSSRDVLRQEPNLEPGVKAGFFFPKEAQVDNVKLMDALAAAVRNAGVTVLEHTLALRLLTDGEKVAGVRTNYQEVRAPVVVNCLGSWAGLGRMLSPHPVVVPARGQMLSFQAPGRFFRRAVMSDDAYGVQRRDGQLLVGSTVEFVGFDKHVTLQGMERILAGFRNMVRPEALARCIFQEAWAGFRPCSVDRLPILGAGSIPGLFVAIGHFRHGILLAPMTAKLIAELIFHQHPSFDPAPFSPQRFVR